MKTEFYWTTMLTLLCLAVVYLIDRADAQPDLSPWTTLGPRVLGVLTCYASSLIGSYVLSGTFEKKNPVAGVLLAILIRQTVLIGAIVVATATKWSDDNSFVITVVGCYFSFLALESCLAIKRSYSRT